MIFVEFLVSSSFRAGRKPVFDVWDSLDKFEGWNFTDHRYQFVRSICSCIGTWCGSSFPQLGLRCGLWTSWKIETLEFFLKLQSAQGSAEEQQYQDD